MYKNTQNMCWIELGDWIKNLFSYINEAYLNKKKERKKRNQKGNQKEKSKRKKREKARNDKNNYNNKKPISEIKKN